LDILKILTLTLQIAAVGTLINIPFALAISWLIVKKRVRGKFLIDILASLPLALPPVVLGYFLLLILGKNGPIGSLLYATFEIDIVFTWVAASLATSLVSFPLMTRTMMIAMSQVDNRLEMSARMLGASQLKVALTITIPLAYRGIIAGIIIGFIRAMSEFGATMIVAGNIPGKTQTIPLAIFQNIQIGDDATALRLVGIATGLAIITLLAHNWLLKRVKE
jgi:molybdate transport system permease protein